MRQIQNKLEIFKEKQLFKIKEKEEEIEKLKQFNDMKAKIIRE